MSLAVTPRSASGRWSLVFAAITVVMTIAAWAMNQALSFGPPTFASLAMPVGQACIAPATATAALGLLGIIHHRERSTLAWAATLLGLGLAIWAAWLILNAVPRY